MACIRSFPRVKRALLFAALLPANMLLAQDACDSLEIVSLTYAPFTDTAMQVVVRNNGTQFFGYPRFWLVDGGGDTLAREPMNFFGLAQGEQIHRMDLDPGITLPTTPFTGTLVFFFATGNGDSLCTFPITTELCPPACVTLQVYLYSQFGSTVTSSFPWHMSDSTGAMVGSGTLAIDTNGQQQDLDTLCMPPGAYTLHIEQPVLLGLEFQFGVTEDVFITPGPSGTLPAGGSMDLPFNYYPACIGVGMGLEEEGTDAPMLTMNGRILTVTEMHQHPLGEVALFDTTGRCLLRVASPSSTTTIDLCAFAAGVHLVSVRGTSTRRIMLP